MKLPIAQFDMDNTLCNYADAMQRDLQKLKSPGEPDFQDYDDNVPDYIKFRQKLIKERPGWWEELEPLEAGFDLYLAAINCGYKVKILTKGPTLTTAAWTEKRNWCHKYLHGVPVTITEDKTDSYGKILCDDYWPYVEAWLKYRPRGLVIMVAQPWNAEVKHEQVIRYDGKNMDLVINRMLEVKKAVA